MQNSALPRVLRVARVVPQPAHQFERLFAGRVSRPASGGTVPGNPATGEAEFVKGEMPQL